jgi:outer membrane lipoprotein carrier protein
VRFRPILKKFATVVWFFAAAAGLSAQDSGTVVERFERAYRSSNTLQASFMQRYSENGREVRSEAGVAYFGRPGKMRWEYQSPERNLYVIDGKWSWFYVPADHTVTRIRAKESYDWRTPLALLAGEMKVSRICARVWLDSATPASSPANLMLRCELRGSGSSRHDSNRHPVPAAEDDKVLFEVNSTSGQLSRIIVSAPGGVQVEFRFANWQFGPRLAARIFRFDPPQGVAIVDGDLGAPGSSAAVRNSEATAPNQP